MSFTEDSAHVNAAHADPANAPAPQDAAQQLRIVVLASGGGTLLQAILDAANSGLAPVEVAAVFTDRECEAVARAQASGVRTQVVAVGEYPDRSAWDAALSEAVAAETPDLVVSAGFMKILGPRFIDEFAGRTINTHPALLPAFPGAHGVRDALAYGVKITGCTVHLVDAGVDTGPILAQRALGINAGETEDQLHERIKVLERELIVSTLVGIAAGEVDLAGAAARRPG